VQPDTDVCGYYFPPGKSAGDTARMLHELVTTGVHIYRTNNDAIVYDAHNFGPTGAKAITLPKGSIWIPMEQGQKHWIQAVLGENPYLPYPYNYDVTTWSYPLTRGIAGSGFLKAPLPPYVSLSEITDPGYGTVTNAGSPVYAFDTDSAQSLGLVMDLLSRGATVSRAAVKFSAANHAFVTGAALVDGASLNGIDLAGMAAQREIPMYGLAKYPVDRYQLVKPKIALFSNSAAVPSNPIQLSGGAKGACSGGFCEALFVLTQKMKIPASLLSVMTTTDLAAGKLVSDGYTAFVNPASTISNQAQLDALKAFVNGGGRYIGNSTNGTTTARNAGLTKANTQSIPGNNTPGSLFDGTYDTTDPLAWGYDAGGWIYRDLGSNANYDPATLIGDGTIPDPKVAVKYGPTQPANDPKFPNQMYGYGYDVNARGPGQLPNRPAMIDQPFGSGRALLLGTNPYYRAWIDGEERMVANGVLFPLSAPIAPNASQSKAAAVAAAPAAPPIVAAKLPAAAVRPDAGGRNISKDVRITVKRSQARTLQAAVAKAHLSKALLRKLRYVHTKKTTTLVLRNARGSNPHLPGWVVRVMNGLEKRKVRALRAQV
jgi:hypothetical protein